MNRRTVFAIGLLSFAGCAPETRTYSVTVRNESAEPMTVVLTKDGPPMEMNWLPPEDFAAMRNAPPQAKVNGVVVPPGKTAEQSRQGQFREGVRGQLRVYRGKQTLETMLGISPTSPNRTDIYLQPGDNTVVIDAAGVAVRR